MRFCRDMSKCISRKKHHIREHLLDTAVMSSGFIDLNLSEQENKYSKYWLIRSRRNGI